MAMIGSRDFTRPPSSSPDDISTIDTTEKLLAYAQRKDVDTIPLDVYSLADAVKIRVKDKVFSKEHEDFSGVLYREPKSKQWTILINSSHHPNRKRYTIAHELGHWCLHRFKKQLFEDKIFFRGGESTKFEWQANDFASEILMPADTLRQQINSGTTDVEGLARVFQVSTIALRVRAKKLGMRGHGL